MPRSDQPPTQRGNGLSMFMIGAAAAVLVMALAMVLFISSGVYDIAAATPHWSITRWVMQQARNRSIAMHAAGIKVPPGLGDPQEIVIGTEHFAAHCASCHGGPGVPRGEAAEGLYPPPPDLAHAAAHYTPAELFWIVRNGIKMTGMPNWSDHSDAELWATVAFIEKLPGMTQQQYGELVMQGMKVGGRHQHDEMAMPSGFSMPPNMPKAGMEDRPAPGTAPNDNGHHQ